MMYHTVLYHGISYLFIIYHSNYIIQYHTVPCYTAPYYHNRTIPCEAYEALVWGWPAEDSGEVDKPIGKDRAAFRFSSRSQ